MKKLPIVFVLLAVAVTAFSGDPKPKAKPQSAKNDDCVTVIDPKGGGWECCGKGADKVCTRYESPNQ